MRLLFAIVRSLFFFAVAAFCVFGFLATFEPTNNPGQFLAFRVGYSVIGLANNEANALTTRPSKSSKARPRTHQPQVVVGSSRGGP
jgi:hypothetical protein